MKMIVGVRDGELRQYMVDDAKDFHCNEGSIAKDELKKSPGSVVKTNRGVTYFLIDPAFLDRFFKIRRLAQIIPLKDLGSILVYAKISRSSVIADAGSGSGALACFLAHHAKKVRSFDIRDDHLEVASKNKEYLQLKNLEFQKHDAYTGFPIKNVDAVTLDLPEPWKALPHAKKALKVGGYIVSYNPSIPQTQDFVNAVLEDSSLLHERSIEILEREWEIDGRRVRPKTQGIGHSGFLTFVRKVVK